MISNRRLLLVLALLSMSGFGLIFWGFSKGAKDRRARELHAAEIDKTPVFATLEWGDSPNTVDAKLDRMPGFSPVGEDYRWLVQDRMFLLTLEYIDRELVALNIFGTVHDSDDFSILHKAFSQKYGKPNWSDEWNFPTRTIALRKSKGRSWVRITDPVGIKGVQEKKDELVSELARRL